MCNPAQSGYAFTQGVDAPGNDIGNVPGTACDWISKCDAQGDCLGFNTNGWLKTKVSPTQPESSFRGPDQGLWIHSSRAAAAATPPPPPASPVSTPVSTAVEEGTVGENQRETGVNPNRAQIQQAMDQINRLKGKNVTDAQKMTAYRMMMLDQMKDNAAPRIGLHSDSKDLFDRLRADPDVKDVMMILGDGTDDGANSVIIQDLNEWAGAISKREGFSGGLVVGGFSLQRVLTIAVLAFVFYQILVNQRQIKAALKKMFKK